MIRKFIQGDLFRGEAPCNLSCNNMTCRYNSLGVCMDNAVCDERMLSGDESEVANEP